eukprot:UN23382
MPSNKPTLVPSKFPSWVPTMQPSSIPSNFPTKGPTSMPTQMPSSIPSESPTILPSNTPTILPTYTPSVNDILILMIKKNTERSRNLGSKRKGVFWENPGGILKVQRGIFKIQEGEIQMEVVIFLVYYKQSPIFYFLGNPGGDFKIRGGGILKINISDGIFGFSILN